MTADYRSGYPDCILGSPPKRQRRYLSTTDDLVDHALVERRFLQSQETLDGIVELMMIESHNCPDGYRMVDRDASLSGNLQQGSYSDTPSFLCVKFGSASEYSDFLLDVEVVPQKRGCTENYTLVHYDNTTRYSLNDAYKVSICAKYGAPYSTRALVGLYLSTDETCPLYFTGMGLRGSIFASDFDGNLNHNSYPGIPVYMCQSSIAVTPPLQAGKNDSLIIIGENFAKEGNEVRVGEKLCQVTSEERGRIECLMGEGIGKKQVTVTVPEIGYGRPRPHKDPNIALGRPIKLKGNPQHGGYGGTRGMVDGISYTNPYNCGKFNMLGGQLYMVMDLGQIERVQHVLLYAYKGQEAYAGARVYVGPEPKGEDMPFINQNQTTECMPVAPSGVFTEHNLMEYDCGGGISAQWVIVQSVKKYLMLCEIEVYGETRQPREFASLMKFETGVEAINGVPCRGDRPCIRLPLFGGVRMTLTGLGFGDAEDVSVSIQTASGFKLCDVKSHRSSEINCLSSARPRLNDYRCQTGIYLDRRYVITTITTDSPLECMTKCTAMAKKRPRCQSLMWNSAHKHCHLSSAPLLAKASSGCDSTVANLDGGNDKCCTPNNPCNIDEGRCTHDNTCRAGTRCNKKCSFNHEDTCCSDAKGAYTTSSWMTCSNPYVVLDEAIATFTRRTDGRKIATATFGMEWNNDMSPTIEHVATTTMPPTQVKSCATLGWLTKMSLPVCGLVLDLENEHYTPVDNLNRYTTASHAQCQGGTMIDGKGESWCGLANIKHDISVGHVTLDLLKPEVVTGVVTQGRGSHSQFVRAIKVAYSLEGKLFKFVVDHLNQTKIFNANVDDTNKVFNTFHIPTLARFVRVHPWDSSSWPSMRVGVTLKAHKLRTIYTKCLGLKTFTDAAKHCGRLGGRLCTSQEVL